MTFWLFYERQTRLHSSKEKKQKDQNNILGGGLLFFTRTDIVFEKLHSFKKAGMEILSIRLETTKSALECISTEHFHPRQFIRSFFNQTKYVFTYSRRWQWLLSNLGSAFTSRPSWWQNSRLDPRQQFTHP